jgi:hypothetical protein
MATEALVRPEVPVLLDWQFHHAAHFVEPVEGEQSNLRNGCGRDGP